MPNCADASTKFSHPLHHAASGWPIEERLPCLADCNVIIVDWGRGSMGLQYLKAVGNTALVGREMSLLLKRLIERHPTTLAPGQVHVVGFSLGAQVAGFFARAFKLLTGQSIWRITGMHWTLLARCLLVRECA